MTYFVKNEGGRIVQIDSQAEYEELLRKGHFTVPTKKEIKNHLEILQANIKAQKLLEQGGLDLYMATVSQGGKDGFGVASTKLIQELRRIDVNVQTYNDNQKVAMLFHNPYSILNIENNYRIIYTMFESTKIPNDWLPYLEAADLVLVPSKWCQKVFKDSGIDTTVVPLGYDDNIYKFVKRKNKLKENKDFVFLHYNAFNLRKGFLEVFKAFNKAFKPTDPVKLILKTTLKHIPLPITKKEYPNIVIETGNYSDSEMLDLLYKSDAFIFPSRGEGFGMTPLEAMATGLPTIVPNAHGITEYFNDRFMYEVKVSEMCPAIYSRYKNQDVGEMSVCDIDHLAKQMRYIFEHQDEALNRGEAASKYVKQWTYSKTAQRLKSILETIITSEVEERPLRNVLKLDKIV